MLVDSPDGGGLVLAAGGMVPVLPEKGVREWC